MDNQKPSFWNTPQGWAALGLIGAVSYFLLIEHRQHLFEWLPFLILLLCPLIHFFMHGSHGGHGSHDHHEGHEHHHKQSDKHNDDTYRQGFEDGRSHKNKDHEGE